MGGRKPVVIVVEEQQLPAVSRRRKPPARSWLSNSIGVLGAAIVHILFTAPLLLGVGAHKSKPRTAEGPGSVAWASQGEQFESMILLDLAAITTSSASDVPEPFIETEGITPDELELQLASLDLRPPSEPEFEDAEEAEVANEAAGDPAGNAAMFGRYMGQVAARIERVWIRPRSAIEGRHFDCRARITQDRRGNVLAIELQSCGSDERWRASLTSAILRASPLTAPPEQWLFAETITLTFSAEQYAADQAPEHGYEPAPDRVAQRQPAITSPSVLDSPGDVELTITGTQVQWAKKKSSVATRQ